MLRANTYLLIFVFFISSFTQSFAQEVSKTRIAFHKDIYTVDRSLDQKIDYFSEQYEGFRSAELFKLGEDKYALEIEREAEGGIQIQTMELTKEEMESLRSMIASRIKETGAGVKYDQSGRYLKVQSIAVQGGLAGLTASAYFSNNTSSYAVGAASPLIGLGGGVLGGVLGTANKDVPLAPTLGYASGAFTGALHGLLVGSLFVDEIDDAPTGIFLGATVFSVGESLLLQHIIKKKGLSAKRASAVRLGNISGAFTGAGLSLLLGGDEPNLYLVTGLTIGGSVGGMLLYDQYFKDKDIAVGNLQAIRLMNPVFTIGMSVIASDLIDDGVSPAVSGVAGILSSVGGVFLGEAIFGKGNVTYNESLWYGLGLYGGYLIGNGVNILVLENNYSNNIGAIYAGISTLFSLGGLYAVHSIVANNYDENGGIGFLEKNNIFIEANPTAMYVNRFIDNPRFQQNALSVRWSF